MTRTAGLRDVLPLWQDRLGRMSGLSLELEPSVPTRVRCWALGQDKRGERWWFGLSRPHAVTLAAGALAWPPSRVSQHLHGRDDHVLLRDAFGELANVAFAALDEVLATGSARPGLRFVSASLYQEPPSAPSALSFRVTLPRLSPGRLMLHGEEPQTPEIRRTGS